MNQKLTEILAFCTGLALSVAVMLTVIDLVCFFKPFYTYEYKAGHQAEKIGMSEEGLQEATDTLLDYLQDRRDDIIVETEVNGMMREVYDMRETLHMVDVKNLYQGALKVRGILALCGCVLLGVLVYFRRGETFGIMKRGYTRALGFLFLFLAFAVIYAAVDFNSFWMRFHYIFFDNDLFLLDPNVSIMINMFPERFFFDMVMAIVCGFAVSLGGIWVLLRAADRRYGQC